MLFSESTTMKSTETVTEFAQRVLEEAQFDVSTEYCIKNGIKFDNHEVNANSLDLFTTKSNKAAFDFISK